MSLIRTTAVLIRRAATDDGYAQELVDAVNSEQAAFGPLVNGRIDEDELHWLTPSQWLWFARWRQDRGGPLDPLVLAYLDVALVPATRSFRFEFRGLVMRDQASNDAAASSPGQPSLEELGLQWAERHARTFPDSLEVSRDALQYATPAAWYTLRILTSLDDRRATRVRQWLAQVAAERDISHEITRLWQFEQ